MQSHVMAGREDAKDVEDAQKLNKVCMIMQCVCYYTVMSLSFLDLHLQIFLCTECLCSKNCMIGH